MNSKLQKFVTTGGTVACALAIGFFMQRGETPQVQQPKLAPEPIKQAVLTPSATTPSIPAEVSATDAEIAIQEKPEPKASVVSEPLDTAKSDPVEVP